MANPKRKWSKARTRTRRSQWKLTGPKLVECAQCHELKLPHRACPNCGYYAGKEVMEVE